MNFKKKTPGKLSHLGPMIMSAQNETIFKFCSGTVKGYDKIILVENTTYTIQVVC